MIVLVTGPPGSRKTTPARRLARHLGLAADRQGHDAICGPVDVAAVAAWVRETSA